jgi:hypothetical protein
MISMLSLIALAAVLAGCGTTASPTSPEGSLDSTPPPAPADLTQSVDPLSGSGMLEWSASAAGDVAGYQVLVYQPNPSRDNAYVEVATTAVGVTSWTLPSVAQLQTQNYRVRAVDGSGNRSSLSALYEATLKPVVSGGTIPGGKDAPGNDYRD